MKLAECLLAATLVAAASTGFASTALADRRVFIVANQPDSYGIDQCLANGDRCGASAAALTANRTISNPHPPIIASIRKKSPAR